jgi:hypothetical protein
VFSSHLNITLNVPQFAVAPDGRAIVFVAGVEGERPMLWRRPIDNVRAQALPGTEDAQDPFWSPDSRWIGFFSEGRLKKVSATGGAVQVILSGITDVRGATWGNDDTILLANGSDPILRVTSAGAQPLPMDTLGPDESSHRYPHFLPDGHHFLYIGLDRTARLRPASPRWMTKAGYDEHQEQRRMPPPDICCPPRPTPFGQSL